MRVLTLLFASLLFLCKLHGQSPLFERFQIGKNQIKSAYSSESGELYFASSEGLYVFEGWGFKRIDIEGEESKVNFDNVLSDERGNIFVFSRKKGLYALSQNKRKLSVVSTELLNVLGENSVNEILILDSTIWFTVLEVGGMYKLNLRNQMMSKHRFNSSDEFAFFIYEFGNGKAISGANDAGLFDNKLRIFRNEKVQEIKLSNTSQYKISRVVDLKDKSIVFSAGSELIQIGEDRVIARIFHEGKIQFIHEDQEGKLWIGMENQGVLCYPNGLEESSNSIKYLGTASITSICENSLGEVWISTNGSGIYQFNPGTNTLYEAPPMFSDFDSTSAPTEAIALKEMELRARGEFNPNALVKDTLAPEIFITGVKIMGQDTSILSVYELNHTDNFIEINYLGFSKSSTPIQYRYKLEGANDDWVYTSRSLVQYTTLPPGKYSFSVEAVNKDGVWSENSAKLKFTISPPIWQTTWFRVSIASLGLLLGIGIWLLMYFRVRRKSERRDAFNRKMAQVELQALRAQMNPHFLFNTLSSIQHFITLSKSEEAINYLSKFAKLMRVILENSQKAEIPLKDELSALEIYLELESLRFRNKFDYSIEVDDELDLNYDQIPPLLIQPYVENAIMHGILHLKKKGEIKIRITRQGDFMKLSIEDNGVGRENAKAFENQKMHKSRGMSITKDRLEIINASRQSSLNLKIIDLKDDENNSCGTLVEILIPLED